MFEIFKKKGVPYVANNELQKKIDEWLTVSGLKKGSFGVVLQKLGFDPTTMVYLYKYEGGDKIYISHSDNIIAFDGGKLVLFPNKIELNKKNSKVICECTFDKNTYGKVDVKQIGNQYSKKENGVSYLRDIVKTNSSDEIYITVENMKLDQGISINIKLKYFCGSYFVVYNEKKVQDYLMSLEYPVSIEKVYSDICYLLSDEFIKYKSVNLINYTPSKFDANRVANSTLKYFVEGYSKKVDVDSDDKKVSYRRQFSHSKVDIDINCNDYKMYLEVFYDDTAFNVRKLDNERELENYLINLTFPISIEKVYKDICEISLGDVSKYSRIVLQCCDNSKNGMVTDLIVLDNGNFEKFGMTKNGKTMFIDKYGNFTYRTSDNTTDFEVNINCNDKTKCEMSSMNGKYMDDYIETLVTYDISDARKEKEETKKLVKKIFYNNGNGSN